MLFLAVAVIGQQQTAAADEPAELLQRFRAIGKAPCGERREAIVIGKKFVDSVVAHHGPEHPFVVYTEREMAFIQLEDENCRNGGANEEFLEAFRKLVSRDKQICGKRDEAFRKLQELVERHKNDERYSEAVAFFNKNTLLIEKQERKCKLYERYDNAYKSKNWDEAIAVSKLILAEEADSPKSLDVTLTLVSILYERILIDKENRYAAEAIDYAKQAIRRIEAGEKSVDYGVFDSFRTRENALGWMNYVIGYLLYRRSRQEADALPYFYRAVRFEGDNQKNPFIFTTLSSWYLEKTYKLQRLYEEKLLTVGDGDEARRLKWLANGFAERAIDAILRAMNVNEGQLPKGTEIYRSLESMVRFRFNLPAGTPIDPLDGYFKKLIKLPVPDPATEVRPVRNDPPEIKLIRESWQ